MAEARDELHKLTECSICFKTFTDPRMLPCIHSFCLKCLKGTRKAAKKQPGENMPCPLCRKLFVIPTEGMTGLQRNFFVQHLMDVKPTIQEGQKSVTDCDICKVIHEGDEEKIKEATMMCLECGDNFCDVCTRVHKLHKLSKTHNIVNIGIEAEEDFRKLQPGRTCGVHNQQPLSFYCAKCKKIICVWCFVENHASHKCKDVTSVEKGFREIIAMRASKISKCAEEMLSLLSKTDQRAAEVLLDLAGTEDKILERNMELKKMIESHTQSLFDQLSLVKQKLLKDIAIDKDEIQRVHAIFKSFETYCAELRSKGSASDICDCVDELVARANELEKDHEAFILRPDQKSEVFFKATNLGKFLSLQDNIVGQIQDDKLQQGLNNYFNAVIQCLCQTSPLLEVFRLTTHLEQPLIEAFVTFMNHRNLGLSGQKDACSKFFEQVYKLSPKLNNFRQHESHELFIQFLNDLRSEETCSVVQCSRLCIDSQKVLTAVDIVLGGHFITLYTNCLNCHQPSVECESFLDITLPSSIPKHQYCSVEIAGNSRRIVPLRILTADKCQNLRHSSYRGKATVYLRALNENQKIPTNEEARYLARPLTLTDCLRFCTETEYIPEGYLCLSCSKSNYQADVTVNAQTTTSAMKRTLIYNPPAVLLLHIKRFEQTTTGFSKISDRVIYEELLDLGPYCSSDCLRIDSQYRNVWYSLYGVVVHVGSLESGQYIAYVKIGRWKLKSTEAFLQKRFLERDEVATKQMKKLLRPRIFFPNVEWRPMPTTDEKWICVSDTDIREATSHDALNQEAFMLFYERVSKQDQ